MTAATLTVREAAAMLGVGEKAAYAAANAWLATDGREGIPALRLGHRIVVPRAALDRMLEAGTLKLGVPT